MTSGCDHRVIHECDDFVLHFWAMHKISRDSYLAPCLNQTCVIYGFVINLRDS